VRKTARSLVRILARTFAGVAIIVAVPAATRAADPAAAGATGNALVDSSGSDHAPTPADTVLVVLPAVVVSGEPPVVAASGRTELGPAELARLDAPSLAAVGSALPSTRVAVNSRGDALPMVRGAPERHVQTYLDGIPLNVPWDERVDLETVPAIAVGAAVGTRGPVTLLDGPGTLAGSLRLLPAVLTGEGSATTVRAAGGGDGLGRAEARHLLRAGSWSVLGAASRQTRDSWPLPEDGPARESSDLEQWSLLMRGSRRVRDGGQLSLIATGWTGAKGVPAEMQVSADDARYWRYPVRERALVGAALTLPLDERGDWDLGAAASADFFHQEIDPRGPGGWGAPLEAGQSFEKNWDRTGYGRLRLGRSVGDHGTLVLQGSARYTHHRESLEAGGPILAYAQWLSSLACEVETRPGPPWTVRAGLGWDHAATPESGDKPGNPAGDAVAVDLRVARDLGPQAGAYVALGRRSRYPSLRETYSGALGRFAPNFGLRPERNDQVEIGARLDAAATSLSVAAFYGRLSDGIERIVLPDGRYQRVNRGEIRVPGVELIGAWRPLAGVEVRLQHTILDARVHGGGAEGPAEDRAAYLSLAGIAWERAVGPGALVEARATGPRWSADTTSESGLRRLPAGVVWSLRLAWTFGASQAPLGLHVRVDNVFDQRVDDQTGLPGPGRVVSGGAEFSL